ncbi:MAG: hypothetical protein CSA62_05375 [Planctomycetota bacterium]|nr:MAG: hypothetical protein CSA62_05375 [Planctomycetota bacterium]
MAKRSVDKRVLNILLEAVRGGMGVLREYNQELMKKGGEAPVGMARMLNGARRLQNYLVKAAQNYRSPQDLELGEDEANLLASLLAYRLGDVESYLEACEEDSKEREWLLDRRDALIWLTHRLMTRSLEQLPQGSGLPQEYASVLGLLRYQPDPEDEHSSLILPPRERMRDEGMQALGLTLSGGSRDQGVAENVRIYSEMNELIANPDLFRPDEAGEAEPRDTVFESPSQEDEQLFDLERLHDYKLRTFAKKDLEEYVRAKQSHDLRLCLQSLGALIETALLDYYLPKREECGLGSLPPSWDFVMLGEKLLGSEAKKADVMILHRLLHMGDCLRPSHQLIEPLVLTRGMLEEAKDLLERILQAAGFYAGEAEKESEAADLPGEASPADKPAATGGLWRATKRD